MSGYEPDAVAQRHLDEAEAAVRKLNARLTRTGELHHYAVLSHTNTAMQDKRRCPAGCGMVIRGGDAEMTGHLAACDG